MMLDGGLATTLEARGCDLDDSLWSARTLLESPELIKAVHRSFLDCGADCIATVSYQATVAGFVTHGYSTVEARSLIRLAAEIACEVRAEFWGDQGTIDTTLKPLVAASVGPYGAYLADGSEYVGDYPMDEDGLYDFHAERWRLLADTDVDLMACETIPSFSEAKALVRLIEETEDCWAWLSFSCRDGRSISDGTPIVEVARMCDAQERVAAVGVNCVSPSLVPALVGEIRGGTEKPIVVYPNSGEQYDAERKAWTGRAEPGEWPLEEWKAAGVEIFGGCCRVMPEAIRAMRDRLEHTVN
jgi:homocysteine S-methyltransferase